MQKKMYGILAGVAVAHAVLLVGVMAGGGCRRPEILGPHTFNPGPEIAEVPAPTEKPLPPLVTKVPTVDVDAPLPPEKLNPPMPGWNDSMPPEKVNPPVQAGTTTYKVRKGDNLYKIAYKHGVSVSALAACNNLSGKAMNKLYIGQQLTIPEGGVYNSDRKMKKRPAAVKKSTVMGKKKTTAKKPVAQLPADGMYTVKKGDTLDRIGRRYGVSGAAIAKANNISVKKVLHIGDKLVIPVAGAKTAAAPAPKQPLQTQQPDAAADNSDNQALIDGLDPNKGVTTEPSTTTPAELTPANPPAAPAAASTDSSAVTLKTETFEIHNDTTVEKFCSEMDVEVEKFRQLNKSLPADGILKAGSYVIIPGM